MKKTTFINSNDLKRKRNIFKTSVQDLNKINSVWTRWSRQENSDPREAPSSSFQTNFETSRLAVYSNFFLYRVVFSLLTPKIKTKRVGFWLRRNNIQDTSQGLKILVVLRYPTFKFFEWDSAIVVSVARVKYFVGKGHKCGFILFG